MRLDNYLVINNYFNTRNKAQQAIKSKRIKVNGNIVIKSGYVIKDIDNIEIITEEYEFVSRGGYKLLKAIKEFNLCLNNKIIIDLGASTGGFTDCCLKFNAKKVYAIDVGTNQIDKSLKNDHRVISIENMNIKDLDCDKYLDIEYIVMDVSFISITKLIDKLDCLMSNNIINLIILIKPQFEVQNTNINKNGLVKNKNVHFYVIKNIIDSFNRKKIYLKNLTFSPLRGEKSGNIEYLAHFTRNYNVLNDDEIIKVINNAYSILI